MTKQLVNKFKVSKKKKYFFTILFIFFLRALDLLLTYLYIPDLNNEYNPIVSIFGASWLGLISIQFIVLVTIALIAYFYFEQQPVMVLEKKLNFTDFTYCYFFDKLRPWPQRMLSMPSNMKPHLIFIGFVVITVSISVSLFAILNNFLLIMNIAWYQRFLTDNYKIFFPCIFFIITFGSAFLFFIKEYSKYLHTQNN